VTVARPSGPILVVGGGVAGGNAALAVRDAGFDGEVVLVAAEPRHPYERPPLSKAFLRGEVEGERLRLRAPAVWDERDIEVLTGVEVVAFDPGGGKATLSDGATVAFDRAVLATGARNRRLDVPGISLEGVLDLRTVDDSLRLREAAGPGLRAVVVGMGFIGSEVAASLRARGVEVTALLAGDEPLDRVLGPEVGRELASAHEERGVTLLRRAQLTAFEGDGRVRTAVTGDGRRVECDLAVVGVGVQPNVELAAAAGLAVGDGVEVDELCRTSAPNVFAAGDLAAFPLRGAGRVRVEHFQHAVRHGRAAGRAAAGQGEPFDELPWFWSDQYDVNVQYLGWHRTWDAFEVRGSLDDRSFLGFYLQEGRVQAAVAMNRGAELHRCAGLIRGGRPVAPERLRDESVDVRSLAPA
jgi:3-phenylpropionate/trans-cinnamate dioxygenase ferredoxin reductase component